MKITVIVCTYNRSHSLARTLDSIAGQKLLTSTEWEVLVVDNNSKDQTRDVVEDFCGRYPGRFRYLFEPQQGLCYARNAGVRESRGDILAFTDDDVILDPAWLKNVTSPLCDGEWAGSGGRILPDRIFVRPRWLSDQKRALAPLTLFDEGPDAYETSEPPYGANMAFQKRMFKKYGTFRTDLDRSPEGLLSSGDTEYGHRLLDAGERLRYEGSAVVYHPVPENRMHKRYFLAWAFGKGRSNVRQWGPRNTRWRIGGVPLILLRSLIVCSLKWMLTFDLASRFSLKVAVWETVGEILESYRLSRDRNKERSPSEKIQCR